MVGKLVGKLKGFRYELLLLIAGILGFIGFFSPWAKAGEITFLGPEVGGGSAGIGLFGGPWLMIIAALIKYGSFNSTTLENMDPWTDTVVGIIGAILVLVGGISFLFSLASPYSPTYGFYISLTGSFLGLFSAIAIYWANEGYEGEGLGDRDKGRRSSGGL